MMMGALVVKGLKELACSSFKERQSLMQWHDWNEQRRNSRQSYVFKEK